MIRKIIKSAADRGDKHTGYQSGDPSPRRNPLMGAPYVRRQVYPSSEIAHKWAHQTQESARNPQGNFYFRGATLYSYRDSYPIARLYTRKGRAPLALLQSNRYSATTAGHIDDASRAASHLRRITVPFVVDDKWSRKDAHVENVKALTEQAAQLLTKAQRALSVSQVAWRSREALQAFDDVRDYMAFFGIRRKAPVFPQDAWTAARLRAERIENPDLVRDARKIKQRAQRQEAARKGLQAQFDAYCATVETYNVAVRAALASLPDAETVWRETGQWPAAVDVDVPRPYAGYTMSRKFQAVSFTLPEIQSSRLRVEKVLLRIDGEAIVTSLGARVPLAAAPMVWTAVERQRRLGQSRDFGANRALGRPKIGDYPLDRIDADGTLHAGCHTIAYDELALLARALGLAS